MLGNASVPGGRLNEKDLVLTVGNPLRQDDGVGFYVCEKLSEAGKLRVFHTDGDPSIGLNLAESFRPERLIVIDGADFGGKPGEVRTISPEELGDVFLSTHEIPISVLGELIERDFGCAVLYIGIQVVQVGYGVGIHPEVLRGADELLVSLGKHQGGV